MYTSDIKTVQKNALRTALIYLAASILCAVFGAVYEVFSHEVYSYYMIYAFLFPLVGGALPFFLLNYAAVQYHSERRGIAQNRGAQSYMAQGGFVKNHEIQSYMAQESVDQNPSAQGYGKQRAASQGKAFLFYPAHVARSLYHCGIIALTLGSIISGILEIYGTTNPLIAIYWFAGAGLLLSGIIAYFISFGAAARRKATQDRL